MTIQVISLLGEMGKHIDGEFVNNAAISKRDRLSKVDLFEIGLFCYSKLMLMHIISSGEFMGNKGGNNYEIARTNA